MIHLLLVADFEKVIFVTAGIVAECRDSGGTFPRII
jgi:hypothetical protein